MDRYHIALFVHLFALMLAAGATAVTKLAAGRRARARTVGEVLDWHTVLASASKVFPIALAAFVVTGSYMVSVAHIGVWTSGFVVAGIAGSVLLLASGAYLGAQGKALGQMLAELASKGANQPAPALVPRPFAAALPPINSAISLAVVFDMATKPSVPVALGVLGLGIALGAAIGFRSASTQGRARRSATPRRRQSVAA